MLASALACVLATCAPPQGSSFDGLAAVRSVLQRTEGATPAKDEVLVRRLVALGPQAAPALFSVATGESVEALLTDDDPAAWMCPTDRVSELALAALAELPGVPVRALLRAETRARPEREVRVVALHVLGRQGSAEGLALTFELLAESGDELEQRAVRSVAGDALLAMLRSDGATAAALERPLLAAPRAAQHMACEALARCNRPAAVALVTKLFGIDPELDLAALEALTQLGERYPWRVGDDVLARLRKALGREDARLRAEVARGLGRLKDGQSFRALVALLEDRDSAVVRAAQWALCAISGETRILERAHWLRWFEAESAWCRDEAPAWIEAVDPADPARLAEAVRVLLDHPLARDPVVDALASTLPAFAPEAQRIACGALERLGSRRCVPALVELLFESDEGVRSSAWRALRTLTGEELPPEPHVWESYALD